MRGGKDEFADRLAEELVLLCLRRDGDARSAGSRSGCAPSERLWMASRKPRTAEPEVFRVSLRGVQRTRR